MLKYEMVVDESLFVVKYLLCMLSSTVALTACCGDMDSMTSKRVETSQEAQIFFNSFKICMEHTACLALRRSQMRRPL